MNEDQQTHLRFARAMCESGDAHTPRFDRAMCVNT